ncbi:hypothetical protein AN644_03560 [Candidatus Epulonipiscium fishelsonii]|nr:hypothetical protein AN644_03560 [Epulopiscium sp. SCG-C06WGA-EpuloA1]
MYFMKDEAITYLEANIEQHIDNYAGGNKDWVEDEFNNYKGCSPFIKFKTNINIDSSNMDMSKETPAHTDYGNVKILYMALKNISNTEAADKRFWIGLAHNEFWDYMQYRAKLSTVRSDKQVARIYNNYFFSKGSKKSLILHPLARLWWVGRLLYDETLDDPFQALEYLKNDFTTKVYTFFSSNFSNNPIIARATLNAVSYIDTNVQKVSRENYQEIIRYVNILSGTTILDYLPEEELKVKIIHHYCALHNL